MHFLNKNNLIYNDLYNKIISLTREKFLYTEIFLKDELVTRIYLILFHLGFILQKLKSTKGNKEFSQNIHDLFFKNIELHLREIGYGDVTINKKMKDLIKLFHEILIYCEKWDFNEKKVNVIFLTKLFDNNTNNNINAQKLLIYLDKFRINMKYISLNLLLKGIITKSN